MEMDERPRALPRQTSANQVIDLSDTDDEQLVAALRPPRTITMNRSPYPRRVRRQSHQFLTGTSDNPQSLSDSDDGLEVIEQRHHKRVKREHRTPVRFNSPINQYRSSPPQLPAQQQRPELRDLSGVDPETAAVIITILDDDDAALAAPASPGTQTPEPDVDKESKPWKFDNTFDFDMYCGPGYEEFPVALGTVEGHREECDLFRQRSQARAHASQSKGDRLEEAFEKRALKQVLELFPDVSHDFVGKQCALLIQNNPQVPPDQLRTEDVINNILEQDGYPKQAKKKDPKAQAATDGTGITINVKVQARNGGQYLREGLHLLAWQFLHVPTHYIFSVLHQKKSIYDTYLELDAAENRHFQLSSGDRPYRRGRKPRISVEKKYGQPSKSQEPQHYQQARHGEYGHWVNEIQAAKQILRRQAIKANRQEEESQREAENLEQHRQKGLLVQCQVCFDEEIPVNRSVSCQSPEGHLFCFSCVTRLADTQVGQMKYEMKCMHGDGCAADLDADGIGQAVPLKTVDRLAFNLQQADIKAAGLDGLEECPVCDFKAIVDEDVIVFICMNPDCGRASCRKCKEEAHVPLTCEESKNDRGLDARHAVEEARTKAILRPCAKCNVPIIKELGCNKMTCTQCGCLMCYMCKEDISKKGYDHFNKGGSKCALYDQDTQGLHDAEADAAELEAIKKAKAEDADLDEKKLQIETGKLKPPAPQVPNQAGNHPFLQGNQVNMDEMLAANNRANRERMQARQHEALQRQLQFERQQQQHRMAVRNQPLQHPGALPGGQILPDLHQPRLNWQMPPAQGYQHFDFPEDLRGDNEDDNINPFPFRPFDFAGFGPRIVEAQQPRAAPRNAVVEPPQPPAPAANNERVVQQPQQRPQQPPPAQQQQQFHAHNQGRGGFAQVHNWLRNVMPY